MTKPQPDLSGNPFLPVLKVLSKLKSSGKKDWERKAEIAATKKIKKSYSTESKAAQKPRINH